MLPKNNITESDDFKNEELILYITSKLKDHPNFGSILLNKVLYYTDNIHYLKYGSAISSLPYIKQQLGPTPAPKVFLSIRDKMVKSGSLEFEEIERFGLIQKRLIAKKQPNLAIFKPSEIELINIVIDDCKEFTASKLSDFSHKEMAWKLALLFEELPLYTYLLTQSEIDEEDVAWAKDKIKAYGSMSYN